MLHMPIAKKTIRTSPIAFPARLTDLMPAYLKTPSRELYLAMEPKMTVVPSGVRRHGNEAGEFRLSAFCVTRPAAWGHDSTAAPRLITHTCAVSYLTSRSAHVESCSKADALRATARTPILTPWPLSAHQWMPRVGVRSPDDSSLKAWISAASFGSTSAVLFLALSNRQPRPFCVLRLQFRLSQSRTPTTQRRWIGCLKPLVSEAGTVTGMRP
jgi:hypothetical protein